MTSETTSRFTEARISVLDHVVGTQNVPTGLVSALESIALVLTRDELYNTVAQALFACSNATSVTLSSWDESRSAFYVTANYKDGTPWEFQVGNRVPDRALTYVLTRERRPIVRYSEEGDPPDPDWFIYPVFLGVPVVDSEQSVRDVVVLGYSQKWDLSTEEVYYVELITQSYGNALNRVERYEGAIRAGQTIEREFFLQSLHDSAIQDLFVCEMIGISLLQDENVSPSTRGKLENLLEHTRQANRSLRFLLSERSPVENNPIHLDALVSLETRVHIAAQGAPVTVLVDSDIVIPSVLHDVCRSILRESLRNVRKHARASNVIVYGAIRGDSLHLAIEDDGVGMDAAGALDTDQPYIDGGVPHFGLYNLAKIVDACKGTCTIESEPGEGTAVRVRLPLKPKG